MEKKYRIEPCSGMRTDVLKGEKISIVDVEGGQVVDFFAEMTGDSEEFVSPGVTMDCNESLKLRVGDVIYSNRYRPMFKVIYDDVREHDLFHPCCRTEMYDFFYDNGKDHPNCLDNINKALGTSHSLIHPINLFMHTKIHADGSFEVCRPLSAPNDKIVLEALENVTLGIAACCVSESECNGGRCTSVDIIIQC